MNCEYLKKIEGIQFMPVKKNKKPIFEEWQKTKRDYDLKNVEAVGLVCGEISGNIEVIDIDCKYDLTGTLFRDFKKAIHDVDKKILTKLVVQQTGGGGYHFIYRTSDLGKNLKLANRPTTTNEKQETYRKSVEDLRAKGKPEYLVGDFDEFVEKTATRAKDNDKVRVLLETRGDRGFVVCDPSEGYKIIHGSLENIQEITTEERATLFNVAYSFNQVLKEPAHDRKIERKRYKGLSPSEDYNNRGDIIKLLTDHGWSRVGRKGNKILMRRPGDTKADHSGNFDEEKNWFSVFSTSTEFEAQTPYQPYAVFAILECGGRFDEVPGKLRELGFGDEQEEIKNHNVENPISIDTTSDEFLYIAREEDYDGYLHKWRTNSFEKGKGIGCKEIDDFFLFKEADFVVANGIDNVGKSTIKWYLAVLSCMYHGWDWIIWSSENKIGGIVRKMIEFYWCEPIEAMTDAKYQYAKTWVKDHFTFIKNGEKLYNYQEMLLIAGMLLKRKHYKGFLLEPYNSLKIDKPEKSNQSAYDYHYEAASNIKLFGQTNNVSIFINMHVGTTAARNKDKDTKFTLAPQKEDSEMGVMFANKADQFLTIHRNTQSEHEFNITELHVRKVKETETGGRVTPLNKPIILKSHSGTVGFDIMSSKDSHSGFNPVREWHKNQKKISQGDMFKGEVKEYVPESSYIMKAEDFDTEEAHDLPF